MEQFPPQTPQQEIQKTAPVSPEVLESIAQEESKLASNIESLDPNSPLVEKIIHAIANNPAMSGLAASLSMITIALNESVQGTGGNGALMAGAAMAVIGGIAEIIKRVKSSN